MFDPTILVYLAALVVGIILLLKVFRFFFKIVGLVLILAVLYFFLRSKTDFDFLPANFPFKTFLSESPLQKLERTLCEPDSQSIRCECIFQPIYEDLQNQKLSEQTENTAPEQLKNVSLKDIKQSFGRKKEEIRACLIRKNGEKYLKDLEKLIN